MSPVPALLAFLVSFSIDYLRCRLEDISKRDDEELDFANYLFLQGFHLVFFLLGTILFIPFLITVMEKLP